MNKETRIEIGQLALSYEGDIKKAFKDYWRYKFAGLAMQSCTKWLSDDYDQDLIARRAVEMADALLAELEKTEGEK